MELLRLAKAARRLGIHPATLRIWADEGRVPVTWVGRERRFSSVGVDSLKTSHGKPGAEGRRRLEVLYVRVSGSGGQEASPAAQEHELRDIAAGEVARVFRDRASGLREIRPGLTRLLAAVADGDVNVVRVTREGRLARFGAGWLRQRMAARGASLEVLHPRSPGGMEELMEDFISLVATFAGRLYGMRSAEARRRLLTEALQRSGDGDAG